MPISDLLAGAASFAAISGGLMSRSWSSAIGKAIGGFVLIFLCSAALGSAFPMGLAHLSGAALLGLAGFLTRAALYQGRLGRTAWAVATGSIVVSVIGGALVALASGERQPFRGLLTAIADYQDERLLHAKAMLRGEAELPVFEQWRALTEASLNAALTTVVASPIEYAGVIGGYTWNYAEIGKLTFRATDLYHFGNNIRAGIKAAFPGDPARRYEVSHMLVQGW